MGGSYKDADGTNLTKAEFLAKTSVVTSEVYRVFNSDIQEAYDYEGGTRQKGRRTAFVAGQIMKESDINALFAAPTIASVTPITGPAAGGTAITIKGDNFLGNQGVTVGAVACTSVVTIDRYTITCVTGAHAAGATDAIVQDDAGNVTKVGAFTYV